MFEIKKQLTNMREPKSINPELVTSPTEGTIKLTEPAADLLGLTNGDYLGVVVGEVDATEEFFVYKGSGGIEGEPNNGMKMSSQTNKVGGTLIGSSVNTWKKLGGNSDILNHFSVLGEDSSQEHEGIIYFQLEHVNATPKLQRSSSTSKDEVSADVNEEAVA